MEKPKDDNEWDPRMSFHLPPDGVLYHKLQKHLVYGCRKRLFEALLECLCDYLDKRGEMGIALICSHEVYLEEKSSVVFKRPS